MIAYGPGSLPNVAAYDQQNIQRLKKLGSSFNNLGYQGQLGTKQLERLANTMSSLPQPAAPVVQAPWTPPTVQPVSDRAGFVRQGIGPTMNLSPNTTWKADPMVVAPPAVSKSPQTPFKSPRPRARVGASAQGQGKPSSLSQTPYQSDIGKDKGGAATGGPIGSTSGGLSGLAPNNAMASNPPVVSNPLANLNNPKANQASLAATSATPATTPKAGVSTGKSPMAKPGNQAIAGGLDPTGGKNFLSNPNTGLMAMNMGKTTATPTGTAPVTPGTMGQKKKPGRGKGK